MHLTKLDLQGFKSFAHKTTLIFTPGMTAIVGPNGSGKSNVADAIRWVLGEQSSKTLRAKKGEDVIFAGSQQKSRAGFASVALHLNNEDASAPIEYREIVIERRLYRTGESDYLLNKSRVRLQDILMFLAKANFGQKSYGVVGQGMIDSIIHLTPEARKSFFDEAVGVKPYQMKRDASVLKLNRASEHLQQSHALIAEIEPTLRSLTRQIKKLERRDALEKELRELQLRYFGHLWLTLTTESQRSERHLQEQTDERAKLEGQRQALLAKLETLEKTERRDDRYHKLLNEQRAIEDQRQRHLQDLAVMKGKRELEWESKGQGHVVFLHRQRDEVQTRLRSLDEQLSSLEHSLTEISTLQEHKKQTQLKVVKAFEDLEYQFLKAKEAEDLGSQMTISDVKLRLKKLYHAQEQFLTRLLATKNLEEFNAIKTLAKEIGIELAKLLDDCEERPEQPMNLMTLREELERLMRSKDTMVNELHALVVRLETTKQKKEMLESQRVELRGQDERVADQIKKAGAEATASKSELAKALDRQQKELERQLKQLDDRLKPIQKRMVDFNAEEQRKKEELVAAQQEERQLEDAMRRLQTQLQEEQIRLARVQTRLEDTQQQMNNDLPPDLQERVKIATEESPDHAALHPKIQNLKHQLELIGGIDPETRTAYEETKTRYEFLTRQSTDLEGAITQLEKIIDELDTAIQQQFQRSFAHINTHFNTYFRTLFRGGHAKLTLLQAEDLGQEASLDAEDQDLAETEGPDLPNMKESAPPIHTAVLRLKKKRLISGIDIQASPAGKKLKHLSVLSGGEKALTSIALLCAIIENNPPPFVVLDEVEAALDEANSERFVLILKTLKDKTQFLIITHNRVTMHQANIIYGVTMGSDGTSRLLSVKMEDLNDKLIGQDEKTRSAA